MLVLRSLLVIAICRVTAAMPRAPAKAVYDQRQTGDLNVQLELKDLQVIALINSDALTDYTDYDYFYDYSDFTIKPGNKPTTVSTTGTTTTEKNYNTPVSEPMSLQNSTVSASIDSTSPATSNATPSKDEETPSADPSNGTASSTPDNDNDKNQSNEAEDGAGVISSTTEKPVHALRSQKRCKSGYVPNGDGRCRRAGRPWLTRLLP